MYGSFIKSFDKNATSSDLIVFITKYISDTYHIELDIDWKNEIKKTKEEKQVTPHPNFRNYNKRKNNEPQLDEHEEEEMRKWRREWGIED